MFVNDNITEYLYKYKDYEINIDKNSKKGGIYYRQT